MKRRDFFKLGVTTSLMPLLGNVGRAYAGNDTDFDYPVTEYYDDFGPFTSDELINLAKKFGTPLYVYDEKTISSKFLEFRDAFIANYPKVKVHYALKANTNLSLLKILKNLGAHAECISGPELQLGLLAGYKNDQMIFTSSSKSQEEMIFAIKNNFLINLDSVPDLMNLIKIVDTLKKDVRVSFRINPDVHPKTHKNISTGHKLTKFGIQQGDEELLYAYKTAYNHPRIRVLGIHSHIGSQILDVQPFIENLEIVSTVAQKIKKYLNKEIEIINLGGGLGVPYKDREAGLSPHLLANSLCSLIHEKFKNFQNKPELHFEPGRYFVAQSGVFLANINSVKLNPIKNFINVNTGFNHLARPLLYQAHHRVRVLGEKIDNSKTQIFQVAGNICETGDILAYERKLPTPSVGDTLAFLDTGAYGFSMSSEYNSFALPAEVLKTKSGKFKIIRRRGRFEDLLRSQINF